jgi:hypothetical protein
MYSFSSQQTRVACSSSYSYVQAAVPYDVLILDVHMPKVRAYMHCFAKLYSVVLCGIDAS